MFSLLQNGGSLLFVCGDRRLRLQFRTQAIVRVTYTEGRNFEDRESLIVRPGGSFGDYLVSETVEGYSVSTSALTITVDRQKGTLRYFDNNQNVLLREPDGGGKWLTPRPVYRNVFERDESKAFSRTIDENVDGARADAADGRPVFDRNAFEARLDFVFAEDEALFGLGSHEEGYGNLRGCSRELYQQNMKAVVPVLVSTKGYALLLDCASLMTFHDDAEGSSWWAECVDELDFYFVRGDTYAAVSEGLRSLTGPTPLPPRWLFGYVQSKERYVNAQELVEVVREYRRRNVPMDTIVLDWKSWPTDAPNEAKWGQKSFDPQRFPSPQALTAELHSLGARLMISIWPIMTGGCADQRELLAAGLMLGNQSTYDAFSSTARELYWRQAERGLFVHGVDAWWCDCTEPFEADWSGAVKPEPDARLALNTAQSRRYLDPGLINAYSLLHSQGIYEGQRRTTTAKRVVNLTRSSYAGQHRYGTVTWNGDITATWETLRRSIPEGLNFTATGEAYWTTDVGGFFIANNPALWFWRGDYNAGTRSLTPAQALAPDPADTGCTDLGFHELYTRWLQYAVFLPVFRSHGTDAAREIWRFGEEGTRFYDCLASYIRMRYRLLPYLYSLAAQVTFHGHAMLRAVALEYPHDPATHGLLDQFLLGPSLLVCPVTKPMYYGPNSSPIQAEESRPVYLPAGRGWYCFWTGERHDGGQTITAAAPLERIPLYVPTGSILMLGAVMQFTGEQPGAPYELHVYPGADAAFTLYEDAGDGYAYEQGEYALLQLFWHDAARLLTFLDREGSFPQLVTERLYNVIVHSARGAVPRSLLYSGTALQVHFAGLL